MITNVDIDNCKKGANNLTMVQLFPGRLLAPPAYTPDVKRRNEYLAWCEENLGPRGDKWAADGVTVFSYRVIFSDPNDAIIFKLRFGL